MWYINKTVFLSEGQYTILKLNRISIQDNEDNCHVVLSVKQCNTKVCHPLITQYKYQSHNLLISRNAQEISDPFFAYRYSTIT
jgi:hypothetical protein